MAILTGIIVNSGIISSVSFTPVPPNPAAQTLYAGADQIIICVGGTQLNATLTLEASDDISKHTILWEQLSGPAIVSIVDETTLSPIIQFPVSSGDIAFRINVDKGIAGKEKFDDVIIYRGPISRSKSLFSEIKSQNYINTRPGTNSYRSDFDHVFMPALFDSNGNLIQTGQEITNADKLAYVFIFPDKKFSASDVTNNQLNKIEYGVVQEWDGSGWATIETIPTSNPIFNDPPNKDLRMAFVYNDLLNYALYSTNGSNLKRPTINAGEKWAQGVSVEKTAMLNINTGKSILRFAEVRLPIDSTFHSNIVQTKTSSSIDRFNQLVRNVDSSTLRSGEGHKIFGRTINRYWGTSIG